MLIIGFGSKARQGKDSAAEAISEHYARENRLKREHGILHGAGTQVGTFKFATALYEEVNMYLKAYSVGHVGTWQNFRPAMDVQIPEWVQPDPNPEVNELAPYGKHPKLLQWWGSDFRREQDPEYWTKKLFASIPANLNIALISDTRFPNEALGIKQRGGYLVNVQRLREDGTKYYATDRPVDHPSETALDSYNWDFTLINSAGHQALLGEQAITLAAYLRGLNGK